MTDNINQPVAFPQADYGYLRAAAASVGIDDLQIPYEIRQVQELFKLGLTPPGCEEGKEPMEVEILRQITDKLATDRIPVDQYPEGLAIYFNDRGFTTIEESDVPTQLFREERAAYAELMGGLQFALDTIHKEKK